LSTEGTAAPRSVDGTSRGYILAMLTLVYVVNYMDRNILNQLLPSIKAEFHLSDADLGFLSGTVFAILYATLGVPLAWLADRMNRRNVMAVSMVLFAAMTAVSAFCRSFGQLVVARVFTGIGEAGTSPSANAIISDLYAPRERAQALSFYGAGLNIGLLLAFFGGGFIEQQFGWRIAFLAAGIPGLILAILFFLTVPEPRRGHAEQIADDGKTPSLVETAAYLWQRKTFLFLAFGSAMGSFGGYAGVTFVPLAFHNAFHLPPAEQGTLFGLLFGVAGGIGTYAAGVLADRFGRRDVRWNLYIILCFIGCALPFMPIYLLSDNLTFAVVAAIVPVMNGAAYLGPCYAVTQMLVPLRMRAQAAAILLFILNIIGYGTGPLLVGWESDLLHPIVGLQSARWAMLSTALTWSIAAWCFWMASRSLKADLARVSGETGAPAQS
jgi:MFS family permease